jgi:hypothetical protein
MSSVQSIRRRAILAVALLSGLIPLVVPTRIGLAKEFEMQGTIDCGLLSGQNCPIQDFMTLYTPAISGKNEPYIFDMSWIRGQLEQGPQRQDDLICLLIEEVPGVGYRGLAVRDRCEDEVPSDNEENDRRKREQKDRTPASNFLTLPESAP